MNNRFFLIVLALAVLTGCANWQTEQPQNKAQVEVLTDYSLDDGFIVIKARSNGCTFFNSFEVKVADNANNSLEVVRTKPDQCRMKPRTVSLQYSIKHLGLDLSKDVKVANPVRNKANP